MVQPTIKERLQEMHFAYLNAIKILILTAPLFCTCGTASFKENFSIVFQVEKNEYKKKQAKNIFVSSYDMQKIVEKTFKLPNWLHPNGKFQVIEYLLNFYFVSKWSKTKKI